MTPIESQFSNKKCTIFLRKLSKGRFHWTFKRSVLITYLVNLDSKGVKISMKSWTTRVCKWIFSEIRRDFQMHLRRTFLGKFCTKGYRLKVSKYHFLQSPGISEQYPRGTQIFSILLPIFFGIFSCNRKYRWWNQKL